MAKRVGKLLKKSRKMDFFDRGAVLGLTAVNACKALPVREKGKGSSSLKFFLSCVEGFNWLWGIVAVLGGLYFEAIMLFIFAFYVNVNNKRCGND